MARTDLQNVRLREFLYQKAAAQKVPIGTNFELTPLCNFNCRMCYIHQTKQEMQKQERTPMQYEDWIAVASELKKMGLLYILLTGGEPLTWPDFRKLYRELYSMGFLLSINTNGSLIDDDWLNFFQSMPPYRINITLYGMSEETYHSLCGVSGQLQKVQHSIEALHNIGITVKINCSLTPYNKQDMIPILDYASEHNIPIESTTYMFPPVRRDQSLMKENRRLTPAEAAKLRLKRAEHELTNEQYQLFLKSIVEKTEVPPGLMDGCSDEATGQMRCLAGRSSSWVTWDGYLSLCGMMPNHRIDLRTTSAAEGWQKLTEIVSQIRLADACETCANRSICNVCAAVTYAESGTYHKPPQYLCETVEELRREAERQLMHSMHFI